MAGNGTIIVVGWVNAAGARKAAATTGERKVNELGISEISDEFPPRG
jgi:hypothetical protein